jgi:exosortase/archaeosortase family protein
MKTTTEKIKHLWTNPSTLWIRNVLLFLVLLFSFHYIYLWWTGIDFYPFHTQVYDLFDWSSALVFKQSAWVLEHVFNIEITTDAQQTIWVTSTNGNPAYVRVTPACTSLKQWMHWIFLMLLFPGPWKQKLWFIPLGLVVIHFVNVFRIFGLGLTLIPWPYQFDNFHDYFFKTIFYFIIFLMWVVWVEFFENPKKEVNPKNE